MRYFFHITHGTDIPDSEGTELADDEAANAEAMASGAEMLGEMGSRLWNGDVWEMRVVDETGRPVSTLSFRGEIGPLGERLKTMKP